MRKLFSILMMLCLLTGIAGAGSAEGTGNGIPAAEAHAIVDALFRAAAGDADTGEVGPEEAALSRAVYRESVLPFVLFCLGTGDEAEYPSEAYEALAGSRAGREFLVLTEQNGSLSPEEGIARARQACEIWRREIDFESLKELNPDTEAWIWCRDTQIDYPVVHGDDNSYYLNHLIDGSYNGCGTLFVDYRCMDGLQDPNTLIYGHHMRNGSMFRALEYYNTQAFYDEHPYMLILAEEGIWIVRLFAGYYTGSDDHCYDIAISDENDKQEFIDRALEKSDFTSFVRPDRRRNLLTLSTCAYLFENARYVLIGELIPVK